MGLLLKKRLWFDGLVSGSHHLLYYTHEISSKEQLHFCHLANVLIQSDLMLFFFDWAVEGYAQGPSCGSLTVLENEPTILANFAPDGPWHNQDLRL